MKKKKMQNLSLQEYITEQEILTISICKKKKKKCTHQQPHGFIAKPTEISLLYLQYHKLKIEEPINSPKKKQIQRNKKYIFQKNKKRSQIHFPTKLPAVREKKTTRVTRQISLSLSLSLSEYTYHEKKKKKTLIDNLKLSYTI